MSKYLPFDSTGFWEDSKQEWWCNICGEDSGDGRMVETDVPEGERCVSCEATYKDGAWGMECAWCHRAITHQDDSRMLQGWKASALLCVDCYYRAMDKVIEVAFRAADKEAIA